MSITVTLPTAATFGALLMHQAAVRGEQRFLRLLDEAERATDLSYRGLAEAVHRHAAGLRGAGVRPGDRVFLMLPTGLPLIATLFACHTVGAVPVPLYPPFQLKGLGPYLARLTGMVKTVEASLLVADGGLHVFLRAGLGALCPRLIAPEALSVAPDALVPPIFQEPDHPALIQFSSGSTGPQKGVVLTHRQLLANCRAIAQRLALTPGMPGVSWLPLYHDMGLIGGLFIPLLVGMDACLFQPRHFLLDPAAWLRLIDAHRAAITIGPQFAYQLLARRVDPAQLGPLDLGCLRIVLNGAEPIDAAGVRAFTSRFAPLGLRPEAVLSVYGLAEAALGVSMPVPGTGLVTDAIDPEALRTSGLATPAADGPRREVAALGRPLDGYRVAILDADGRVLSDRHEGQIAVAGPSLMQGYFRDPAATAAARHNGWLLTGDLGYLVDGVLHVTGRAKDLIIRGGRNYHPTELEAAAEAVSGVRGGSAVAFGVPDAETGTERVVLAFETREPESAHVALLREVARQVQAATGLKPDVLLALKPGTVPKTTSGKRQRRAARAWYEQGRLGKSSGAAEALRQAALNHWRRPQ